MVRAISYRTSGQRVFIPIRLWFSITLPRGQCPTPRQSLSEQFFRFLQLENNNCLKSADKTDPLMPEPTTSKALSVAPMATDVKRRRALATALAGSHFTIAREFDAYPSGADLTEIARLGCDVVIV